MRPPLAWLILPALIVVLACAGAGGPGNELAQKSPATTEASGDRVLPYLATSSRQVWPAPAGRSMPTAALDGDPNTGWQAEAGEVAAFYTRSIEPPSALGVHAEGPAEVRLLHKPAKGAQTLAATAWTPVAPGDDITWVSLAAPDTVTQGFEVRAPDATTVWEVQLRATGLQPADPRGPWVYTGIRRTSDASGPAVVDEVDSIRFGTFDPEACTAEKLAGGPDQRLTDATCTTAAGGVEVTGAFPPFGRIDELVSVVEISPCLALVDGFPLTRKQGCRRP